MGGFEGSPHTKSITAMFSDSLIVGFRDCLDKKGYNRFRIAIPSSRSVLDIDLLK